MYTTNEPVHYSTLLYCILTLLVHRRKLYAFTVVKVNNEEVDSIGEYECTVSNSDSRKGILINGLCIRLLPTYT